MAREQDAPTTVPPNKNNAMHYHQAFKSGSGWGVFSGRWRLN
ncbi:MULTISPECIES: hypothetical protein [unclassified Okeania]|nr:MULTISPECIES: hypothetical protein [unclassified Okeania]